MERSQLERILASFEGRRVLVVGDCMLDEYVWGKVTRISPEAPVMVVEQERTSYAAGGASNVAANIVAMAGAASIVAVVGRDGMADRLREQLADVGVDHTGLVDVASRPTTVKTRVIAHNQQVVRVDREDRSALGEEVARRLVGAISERLAECEAVLFSDYSKGVLSEHVVSRTVAMARAKGLPVLANPKPASIDHYRGIDLVSVNQSEAEAVTGVAIADDAAAVRAGERLLERCGCGAAFVTRGAHGITVFERGSASIHVEGIPQEVFDVAGAGDSVVAAATLAHAGGAGWHEAATVANLAGNAKVRKLGVVPVARRDIEAVWLTAHAVS